MISCLLESTHRRPLHQTMLCASSGRLCSLKWLGDAVFFRKIDLAANKRQSEHHSHFFQSVWAALERRTRRLLLLFAQRQDWESFHTSDWAEIKGVQVIQPSPAATLSLLSGKQRGKKDTFFQPWCSFQRLSLSARRCLICLLKLQAAVRDTLAHVAGKTSVWLQAGGRKTDGWPFHLCGTLGCWQQVFLDSFFSAAPVMRSLIGTQELSCSFMLYMSSKLSQNILLL